MNPPRNEFEEEQLENWAIEFLNSRGVVCWDNFDICEEMVKAIIEGVFSIDTNMPVRDFEYKLRALAYFFDVVVPDVKLGFMHVMIVDDKDYKGKTYE